MAKKKTTAKKVTKTTKKATSKAKPVNKTNKNVKANKKNSKVEDKNSSNKNQIIQVAIIIAILFLLAIIFSKNSVNINNSNISYNNSNGKTLGSEDAPVTITEWSDFQCGFCGIFTQETLPKIYEEYIATGKVKFVFKHFPAHSQSKEAAKGADCAAEQNKFWPYHELLYTTNDFSNYGLISLAESIELNSEEFLECLESDRYANNAQEEMQEGISAGIRGTPAFLINGEVVSGALPFEEFKKIIDSKLS